MQLGHHSIRHILALLCAALLASRTAVAQHGPPSPRGTAGDSRVAFAHALSPLDGSHLVATVVEVSYGPGGSSPPHSHPCPVIGYVIDGSLRTQVKGEAEAVYTAGQSFYEAPNGVHQVSANASKDKPVRFLAYFVCDRRVPLSTPAP